MWETAASLGKQISEGRKHTWPLSFYIRSLEVPPGSALPLASSLTVPLQSDCPDTKALTGWPPLTTTISLFSPALSQTRLPCIAMQFSLTVLLSLDNFSEGITVVELASDYLSVLLPNYYLDSLLLGHSITAFNLFCPHAEVWSQRKHMLEHLSQSSV